MTSPTIGASSRWGSFVLWGGIFLIMACCRSGALVGWMIVCLLESESYIFLIMFGEWINNMLTVSFCVFKTAEVADRQRKMSLESLLAATNKLNIIMQGISIF